MQRGKAFWKGSVRIRVTGREPERFFNLCGHHNITLWDVTLHVKEREIADDIRAVGIRAHFLATVERPGEENVFPVNESEIWEDPFEWNISFRKNAECSWLQWKIAKTDWSPEMGIPKELYLKEEDILLLTDS